MAIISFTTAPVEGGTFSTSSDSFSVCQLTSSKFLCVYKQYTPNYVFARVLNYNETTGVLSGENQWIINTFNPANLVVRKVDSNKAVVVYNTLDNRILGQVIYVDSNNDIVYLTSMSTIEISNSSYLAQVTETITSSLVVTYVVPPGYNSLYIRRINVSAFDISVSNPVQIRTISETAHMIDVHERIEGSGNSLQIITVNTCGASNVDYFHLSAFSISISNLYNPSLNISYTNQTSSSIILRASAQNIGTGANNGNNFAGLTLDFDIVDSNYIIISFNNQICLWKYSTPASYIVYDHNYNYTGLTFTLNISTMIKTIDPDYFLLVRTPNFGRTNIVSNVTRFLGNYTKLYKSDNFTVAPSISGFINHFMNFTSAPGTNDYFYRYSLKPYKHLFKVSDSRYVYIFRTTGPHRIRCLTIYSPS